MSATITTEEALQIGEQYDPIILMAIFTGGLTISGIISSEIAPGAVDTTNIADNAITANKITAATIIGEKIAANAIDATHIASNSISADDIQTDAIIATKILAGAITTDKIYAGAITSSKMTIAELSSISANLGTVTAGIVTAATIQTSANPAVSRVKMDSNGIMGYDSTLGQTFKIPTDGSSPIFASGQIQNATIIDTSIISNDYKTSSELPWVEMAGTGLAYRENAQGGLYGTGVYGTATYGSGVAGFVGNSSKPFVCVEQERTLSDIRLYNRSSHSSGASVIGDLEVVSGILYICSTAGTPGTFVRVGNQGT